MKTKLSILTLIAVTAIAFADEHAESSQVTVKHALTLEGARKVGEAAMKFAKENGVGPSIAVVDEGGYLLYFVHNCNGGSHPVLFGEFHGCLSNLSCAFEGESVFDCDLAGLCVLIGKSDRGDRDESEN